MSKSRIPNDDIPGWGTLFWDSYKTTNVDSFNASTTIGGVIGGVCLVPVFVASIPFMFCAACSDPIAMAACSNASSNKISIIDCFYYAGMAITAPITIPVGFVIGQVMSLFYTYYASDRKFRTNDVITPVLDKIFSFEVDYHKEILINEILKVAKSQEGHGIRSYESNELLKTLKDNDTDIGIKWQALHDYMYDKSNNGKKLFNAILDISTTKEFKKYLRLETAIRTHDLDYLTKPKNSYAKHIKKRNSYGMNHLHCSVIKGDAEFVTLACETKNMGFLETLVDSHNMNHGKSALYLAAQYGQTDIVDLLMHEDAPCYANNTIHPVIVAAKHGQLATVQRLLLQHQELLSGEIGQAAFTSANANGHLNIVNYLLEERIKNNLDSVKNELQQFHNNLFKEHWKDKGLGFFSNDTPDGIKKQQKLLTENNLGINKSTNILDLTANEIHSIAMKLITLSHTFGKHHDKRHQSTREFYDYARNLGNNELPTVTQKINSELVI